MTPPWGTRVRSPPDAGVGDDAVSGARGGVGVERCRVEPDQDDLVQPGAVAGHAGRRIHRPGEELRTSGGETDCPFQQGAAIERRTG